MGIALLLLALNASAAERMVSVNGTCTHITTPDRASITVTADVTDKDVRSAMGKAAKQAESVKYQVKIVGLPDFDMESTEAGATEDVEWNAGKRKSKGFKARVGIRYSTSDFTKLSRVIEIATKEEIHDIGALQMFVSEKKAKEMHESCLSEAVQNAKAKAELLAKAAGAKVGEVISIVEGGASMPNPPIPMMAKAMMADSMGGAPSIEPGKATINVSVNATFQLK